MLASACALAASIWNSSVSPQGVTHLHPLQVRGLLNTVSGGVDWDANLWKAVHPLQKPAATHSRYAAPRPGQPSPLALMLGATYHSGSDEVVPWLRAKQHLRTPGSWRLKLRGTLQYPTKTQEVRAAACGTSAEGRWRLRQCTCRSPRWVTSSSAGRCTT